MLKSCLISLVIFVVSLAYDNVANGAKVVMIQQFGKSHHMTTRAIGEELGRRGHQVTLFDPSDGESQATKLIDIFKYYPGFTDAELVSMINNFFTNAANDESPFLRLFKSMCEHLIENKETAKLISESDLIIGELQMFFTPFVAKRFKKPWIAIQPSSLGSAYGNLYVKPMPLSYVPAFQSQFTDNMTFIERVKNVYLYLKTESEEYPFLDQIFAPIMDKYGIEPRSTKKLNEEAEVLIGNCDFTFDLPHPMSPNMFCIGPWLPRKASKLPDDVEGFVASNPAGTILVAFGTVYQEKDVKKLAPMANAFGRLKQNVLWHLVDPPEALRLPKNVKTMSWVPQNDVLGHPNTKLFVSHMGQSSMQEGLFHGVPFVTSPQSGDQYDNARRVEDKVQCGERINLATANENDWYNTITKVLSDQRYAENAKKASKRIRAWKKTALERVGDVIEYVIDNGCRVPHLRLFGHHLQWYQLYMLDIVVVGVLMVIGLFTLSTIVLLLLWKKIKKPERRRSKRE